MENIVELYCKNIEQFIINNADSKKIENIKIYLKNKADIIYGIPMKRLKYLFLKYLPEFDNLEKSHIYNIINELFLSKAFEKQVIACILLEKYVYKFESNLIIKQIKEYIINDIIINWAIADQISLNTLNQIKEKNFLYDFAKSHNYLLRRCSVVVFAEMPLIHKDIYMLIANLKELLQEKEEYVMRAAGWACRNILNYDKNKYFEFINDNCHLMPRIMIRNAIEFLDEDIRQHILISSKEKRKAIKKGVL